MTAPDAGVGERRPRPASQEMPGHNPTPHFAPAIGQDTAAYEHGYLAGYEKGLMDPGSEWMKTRAEEVAAAEVRAQAVLVAKVIQWHPDHGGICGSPRHLSLTNWPCATVRAVQRTAGLHDRADDKADS